MPTASSGGWLVDGVGMKRQPLQNKVLESAVITECLTSRGFLEAAREVLSAEDFSCPEYRLAFKLALESTDGPGAASPDHLDQVLPTVIQYFRGKTGGRLPGSGRWLDAADLKATYLGVVSLSRQARIRDLAAEFSDQGFRDAAPVGPRPIGHAQLSTGVADLDRAMKGVGSRSFVLISASATMGKSSLAHTIVRASAFRNHLSVLLVSPDMSVDQIVVRLLSAESHVPLERILDGSIRRGEREKLDLAFQTARQSRLFIHDNPSPHLKHVEEICQNLSAAQGLSLVVIDSLELVEAPQNTDVVSVLRELAARHGVPIVATTSRPRSERVKHLEATDLAIEILEPNSMSTSITNDIPVDIAVTRKGFAPKQTVVCTFKPAFATFQDRRGSRRANAY